MKIIHIMSCKNYFSTSIRIQVFFIFFSLILFQSCISNNRYIYLQKKDNYSLIDSQNVTKVINSEYKLKPGDIVFIKLVTEDDRMNQIFNPMVGPNANLQMLNQQGGVGTPYYIIGYSLDKEGNIELPYFGKLKLIGKNIEDIKEILNAEARKYFKNFFIQVKLAEFRFTVLGSVNRPGQYFFNLNHINILEAIAMAGDLQEIGNRTDVTLLRDFEGVKKLIKLDLTDVNIINSPYFYIQPNDILYVEPVKSRSFGRVSNFQESLGAIFPILSTFLLVMNTYIILQNVK